MSIALKELVRDPRRFLPVWIALTLLVVLLVVLAGFLDGLSRSQTGPYRAYDGDVWVFDPDADLQLQRSRLADTAVTVDSVPGIAALGTLDATFTVAAVGDTGEDPDRLQDVVLYGYELATSTLPQAPADGGVIVDRQLQRQVPFEVGDTITIGPSDEPMTVTAIVDDLTNGAPTVWVNPDEWRRLVATINPAALPPPGLHQALTVRPAEGTDAASLATAISGLDGAQGATIAEAIDALSVVQQQNSTFTAIIAVTFVVSLLVVALFFALITLEQSRLYAVLKALGARTGELLRGISVQAVVITALALVVGIAISAAMMAVLPPTLPVRVLPVRIVQISLGLMVTALVGGLLTARRILRIDPASSIG
ncbi:MAG: ABC transporter permease [Acidimicrobiales bacterium]